LIGNKNLVQWIDHDVALRLDDSYQEISFYFWIVEFEYSQNVTSFDNNISLRASLPQ
jgi:hypothetical protein